jgi:hypothetical protein
MNLTGRLKKIRDWDFLYFQGKTRVVEPHGKSLHQLAEFVQNEVGLEWLGAALKARLSTDQILAIVRHLLRG